MAVQVRVPQMPNMVYDVGTVTFIFVWLLLIFLITLINFCHLREEQFSGAGGYYFAHHVGHFFSGHQVAI